ncbi:MAG: hypothetical protein ACOX7P_06450 [Oscillospiraceae bacterium]
MATVRCSHCGAAFSSHRKECPECGAIRNKGGARLKPRQRNNAQLLVTIILIIAIMICAVILVKMIVDRVRTGTEEPGTSESLVSPGETEPAGQSEAEPTEETTPEPTPSPEPTPEPTPEVRSITLNREDVTFSIGERFTFKATTDPEGVEVIWDSADDSIVQIDEEGNAVAVGSGTSEIAASAGGKSDTCIVRVR